MAPTTSYSSSTATVSALSARGARLFLFSRKAVDLVAVTGRRAPGLGRAGLREARSGPGAAAGGWCLPPGRLRLRSGPGPTAGQVWDARAGLRGPHLAPSCLPGRCPHGAGPVRKTHRLGHQAGEPGCPLLSRGWGVGPSVLPPPPSGLSLTSPYPPRFPGSVFTAPPQKPTLCLLWKNKCSLSLPNCPVFLSGETLEMGVGEQRDEEGKQLLGDSVPPPQIFPFARNKSSPGQTFLLLFRSS